MNPRPAPTEAAGTRQSPPPAVLRGRRLFAARLAWGALATLSVVVFVASVPIAYEQLRAPCEGAECNLNLVWLSPEDVRVLEELGLSLDFYAAYKVALGIVIAMGYWAVGALLFWKRSTDLLSLLASIALVMEGAAENVDLLAFLMNASPWWYWAGGVVGFVSFVSFFVFFCLFPDGRFVPRWMRWVAAAFVPTWLYLAFVGASSAPMPALVKWLGGWSVYLIVACLVVLMLGSLVVAQVYRYRRVSGPVARQQTKWVVYGLAVYIALSLGGLLGAATIGRLGSRSATSLHFYELVLAPVFFSLAGFLIPLSIGVAILRYRLWDIDLIINRTLVYGSLSTVLAAVFAITDTLLLPLFVQAVVGKDNPSLNVVISALIIAVIFEPLRRRIKVGVNSLTDRLAGGQGTSESPR
jgi:hypothetical protein